MVVRTDNFLFSLFAVIIVRKFPRRFKLATRIDSITRKADGSKSIGNSTTENKA